MKQTEIKAVTRTQQWIKERDTTTHDTITDDQHKTNLQFTYLQEKLAAYSVEMK